MNHDALLKRLIEGRSVSEARMKAALGKALEVIAREVAAPQQIQAAQAALLRGLSLEGIAFLDGQDPQRLEDALLAAEPEAPLTEEALRAALLALADELERVGEGPAYGGGGVAESWALTARSRPTPYVDPEGHVASVAARFGAGLQVVIVRGPGRSAFLAALRRRLLAEHGVEALIPPVIPAARDDLKGLLRPYLDRAPLPEALRRVLDQLHYGEDLLGVLGRAAEGRPVALLLDDAHIQSRAALLGLPLFLEPSGRRDALLVLAAPDRLVHDGSLSALIEDTRARQCLHEIQLPAWDTPLAEALLKATRGEAEPEWVEALTAAHPEARDADRLRCAWRWIYEDAPPSAGFDPSAALPRPPQAQATLALAAFEGKRFHAKALGLLLGEGEDAIEDLLFDEEHEIDGVPVGGCQGLINPQRRAWGRAAEGLTPIYRFDDPRLALLLRQRLKPEDRAQVARGLRDHLLKLYGPQGAWQIADTLWQLDLQGGAAPTIHQALLGQTDARRVEAAFKRLAPILTVKAPYHLALARLYGAGMEMGSMGAMTGKLNLADQGFQAAAAAASRLDKPGLGGEAMARLGEMRLAMALPAPARQALDLAEALLKRGAHPTSQARVQLLRSEVTLLEGDIKGAVEQLRVALKQLRALEDHRHAALGLGRLGRALYELGHVKEARAMLDEALKVAERTPDPRPGAAVRMTAAFIEAELGELDPAFDKLQEAAARFQRAGMPAHIAEVAAAGLQRRHGGIEAARARLEAMASAFKGAGAASQWADAWYEVAACHAAQGDGEGALRALKEIEPIRIRARDRFSLIRVYEAMGEAHLAMGAAADGLRALAMARAFAARLGLMGHLGRLDAALETHHARLDDIPELTAEGVRREAEAQVEAQEALWAAPMTAPPSETIH
ncbi:hypothetical protein KKF91_15125 [Myxococcota bacterium]|nr:hypothetical protein [Myxococcota bacterium]MBU1431872.1 hypothetical protein [Myxococcota bacterium]MBU1898022.1 hypothetical protein [Myxococcota bacterium]